MLCSYLSPITAPVSRTRCSVLHAAAQSRDRTKRRALLRPRLCSAPGREEAARCAASGARELFQRLQRVVFRLAPAGASRGVVMQRDRCLAERLSIDSDYGLAELAQFVGGFLF